MMKFLEIFFLKKDWVISLVIGCLLGIGVNLFTLYFAELSTILAIKIFLALLGILIIIHILINFKISVIYLLILTPLIILAPLFEVGGYIIPIRIDDIIFAFLIFIWLLRVVITNRSPFYKNPLNFPIALYFIAYSGSAFVGIIQGTTNTISSILNLIRVIEFLAIFYLIYSITDPLKTKTYIKTILITTTIVLLIGFSQFYLNFFTKTLFEFELGESTLLPTRFATFETSHEYTTYLIFSIFLLSAFLFNKTPWRNNKLLWFFWAVLFFAIINGDARAPILFFLIIFSIAAILFFNLRKRALVLIMIGLFLIPLLIQTPKVKNLFEILFSESPIKKVLEDPSLQIRLTNWPEVIKKWYSHPILGNGPGFFLLVAKEKNLPQRALDNSYLRVLGETGIVGFFAFLFLIYSILKNATISFKQNKEYFQKYFTVGFILFIICMLFIALMTDIFETFKIAMYFWILLAIITRIYTDTIYETTKSFHLHR